MKPGDKVKVLHVQPARKYDELAGVPYEAEVLFVGDDVEERKISWRLGDIIVTLKDYPDFRDDGWVIGTDDYEEVK